MIGFYLTYLYLHTKILFFMMIFIVFRCRHIKSFKKMINKYLENKNKNLTSFLDNKWLSYTLDHIVTEVSDIYWCSSWPQWCSHNDVYFCSFACRQDTWDSCCYSGFHHSKWITLCMAFLCPVADSIDPMDHFLSFDVSLIIPKTHEKCYMRLLTL